MARAKEIIWSGVYTDMQGAETALAEANDEGRGKIFERVVRADGVTICVWVVVCYGR